LALKELSRTNFDDIRYRPGKRKRAFKQQRELTTPEKKQKSLGSTNLLTLARKHNSNKFLSDLKKMGLYDHA
jgi:hypothetical protein